MKVTTALIVAVSAGISNPCLLIIPIQPPAVVVLSLSLKNHGDQVYYIGFRGILAGLAGHAKEKSPLHFVFCTLCCSTSTQHPYTKIFHTERSPTMESGLASYCISSVLI